ncbi:hydrogenase expression/formation protein HypE [Legionella londiniensis]|uniref:Hydrogenase expression/formation protein HypE n=1 Tax=Legionella londiniensis TaxID=45068 RepID=A0A0W0VTB1_9GAMM|nr:hydrogenase expression/formation protein HypE [Legionella londiniensis]KTD23229.1 hydrogenase expression/formation protein HypE [Legionella londiniensis]STX93760.1 hydrogenase expression/formation protein HypE [Legionella londiniensis]
MAIVAVNPISGKKTGAKLNFKQGFVELSHGSGGRATAQLIEQLFHREFENEWLLAGNDQAVFASSLGQMVMTTDSYVISPLFFPGGNIGSLAVNGTINDIAMAGAKPLYLSASFILEEGLPLADLQKIVVSMAEAAREANVPIITGDTKVVERGKGDGVFITTTGVGVLPPGIRFSGNQARPGDKVIVSGFIGDHGVAIMSLRNHLHFTTAVKSDSAPMHGLVGMMIESGAAIRALRDPTRGGVATTLNEWAKQSKVGFIIDETKLPIRTEVASACELLGLDPWYVANEGKLLALCAPEDAEKLLACMHRHPLGQHAAVIGEVVDDSHQFVQLKTKLGGMRIMDWLMGEQLPRIC